MTALPGPRAVLGALPFLEGFPREFVEALTPLAHERSYEVDTTIVREGAPADAFFLLVSGKVALEVVAHDRPRRTIETIGPGEVLGWSWLVPPYRWRLDARAVKPTRLVAIEGAGLRALLDRQPAEGYRFLLRLLPVVAERLENTRVQLLDLHAP